eukprot:symbB.v1.2.007611.t1/scaffold467.1/size200107/6
MVLPCPVILFDSRLERPILVLVTAIIGQLALKFSFSNIIEVKLIESDKKLRMHPVMILLSVGIFGYLWGPTGMLLSVPLMALMKIALFSELVPSSYRDPILVILEGDRSAPQKHGLKASSKRMNRGAVEQDRILGILNRHPVERTNFLKLVEEHLDKLAAPRVIHHKLFSDFSAQFRTLIGVNCERPGDFGKKHWLLWCWF